jgi:hypothetical protein
LWSYDELMAGRKQDLEGFEVLWQAWQVPVHPRPGLVSAGRSGQRECEAQANEVYSIKHPCYLHGTQNPKSN